MCGAMDGTIYDDRASPLFAFGQAPDAAWPCEGRGTSRRAAPENQDRKIAVISNPRSHRNRHRPLVIPEGIRVIEPETRPELRRVLGELSNDGVELIIVAGGDGTVRDVLTCGADLWHGAMPDIGVLPCGKTNALAIDLGIPDDADVCDLVTGWHNGRTVERSAIEISRPDEGKPVLGFLFGAGVFVDATELAQKTHRWGAVNNLAVALSIAGAVFTTVFGGSRSSWRRGKQMAIRYGAGARPHHGAALDSAGARFIFLATTLERLPAAAAVFAKQRRGLKSIVVDAPPRQFLRNFIQVMRGKGGPDLERSGVHRVDASEIAINLEGGFVLDGERFPAGDYVLRQGAPIRFAST